MEIFFLREAFVRVEMLLESWVPFVHSVDLVLIGLLSRALWKISGGPLGETSGQLFDTDWWIFTVVSVNIISSTSLSVIRWSTMWELIFIIESTSLVSSFEVSCHTFSISFEFSDPGLLRWEEWEPVVHNFFGEFNQSVQSLKWVSWWDLLFIILGGGNGNNDNWWDFHFVVFLFYSYRVFDARMRNSFVYIGFKIPSGYVDIFNSVRTLQHHTVLNRNWLADLRHHKSGQIASL